MYFVYDRTNNNANRTHIVNLLQITDIDENIL